MAVIIGSARGDERGGIRGGQAGDQTGREVCRENWYLTGQGYWRVFRAKDPNVAEAIARDMEYACDNNYIGYDQSQNQTLWNVVKPLDFDCSKVRVACETDCSQLLRVCINYAGIPIAMFSTADEPSYLLQSGGFVEMGSECQRSSANLKRGDILVTPHKGHTVVVLTDGQHQKVDEDGYWGIDTTKATQEYLGTPVDGIVSRQYRFNKRYMPNATGGWQWVLFCGQGSAMVKALQNLIGATADGVMGKQTIIALQNFLAARGFYSGSIDGIMGYNTVLGWQKFLNSK
jgi:peptidoglycan hydrolase-like protein with peptidoglycan-binding domain